MNAPPDKAQTTFESTAGGVMTVEVGAVTGELELATHPADDGLHVKIRYPGAEEWYTVEGSPLARQTPDAATPRPPDQHHYILERLKEPGPVVNGNEMPVSLKRFSSPGGA